MIKPFLSVIILHGKEASPIFTECLESVSWANEIIIIDNGMPLKSLEIAKRFKTMIFKSDEINFAKLRNLGDQKAKGDWLFYLDSDEIATKDLTEKIKKIILDGNKSAYEILRRNFFFGREMKHGGWTPDYILRLIKKDALVSWQGELHEQPKIKGEIGKIKEAILHYTHRNLSEMVEKTNSWSKIEAKLLFDAGHPPMAWWRFFSVAGREFWYRGIVKLGFLDGPIGIIEIIYQMFSRMVTYAKLWELQIKTKNRN